MDFDIFICNFCISDADVNFEADSIVNKVWNNKCPGIDLPVISLQQPFASAYYITLDMLAGEAGMMDFSFPDFDTLDRLGEKAEIIIKYIYWLLSYSVI
jgi:hypothetical protein